ncbi:estradiol 17-beta-dehydrogenase 11-like [Varroa jacobsoni]|uniref:estradiol 17-beta-dehydrogenase 11-like n=1 Tax=Varroa jacobsoni TaxID=62625 RepID=UPI000BF922AC|nr:estradiol 17-beta-dehydrogenase 11-like [Varroa jacobsoni]
MAEESVAHIIADFLGVLVSIIFICLREFIFLIVPRPRKNVADKVVLLTGAGHGVGRLIAHRLGDLGARCVLIDINKDTNEAVADEVRAKGQQAWAYQCDVSNEEQIKEIHQRIRREVGPIDILINNAAIVNCQELLEIPSASIRRNFEVNILSHMWTIREFLPAMKERGEGHIVAMSSIAGVLGTAYLTDYCASKFAVRGLMTALEEELYVQGYSEKIHLTTVCPVAINTGMFQSLLTRFAWAVPILEPDNVVDKVIEAFLTNRKEIVLPSYVGYVNKLVNCLLPDRAILKLQRFLQYETGPHKEASSTDMDKKDL